MLGVAAPGSSNTRFSVNVAVLGASDDPQKYSYRSVKLLKEKGHTVFPVHPALTSIDGLKVYASIKDVLDSVDTVSLYVSKEVSSRLADEILEKRPKRLIFNPGAENPELKSKARDRGIQTLEACTLTMLVTNQF